MRNNPVQRIVGVVLVVALLFTQTGCTTAKKYRLVKKPEPPAASLEWSVVGDGVKFTVEHVIVFKGPGSWKREAKWDEYVVRLENMTDVPWQIERAELVDLRGQPQTIGSDPWQLEKQSTTNWQRYRSAGIKLLAGAGAVLVYGTAVSAVALGSLLGGAGATGASAALSAVPVVFLVNVVVVIGLNDSNRKKVETEFKRRRLEVPLEIAPQSGLQGSWFFPMTPAPQMLRLHCRRNGESFTLELPLPELAKLHLKPDKPANRTK